MNEWLWYGKASRPIPQHLAGWYRLDRRQLQRQEAVRLRAHSSTAGAIAEMQPTTMLLLLLLRGSCACSLSGALPRALFLTHRDFATEAAELHLAHRLRHSSVPFFFHLWPSQHASMRLNGT
jgi:hypothetical protein